MGTLDSKELPRLFTRDNDKRNMYAGKYLLYLAGDIVEEPDPDDWGAKRGNFSTKGDTDDNAEAVRERVRQLVRDAARQMETGGR
jgi:hypothetical protein